MSIAFLPNISKQQENKNLSTSFTLLERNIKTYKKKDTSDSKFVNKL